MTSETLTRDGIDLYWANGYAFVENALSPEQLETLVSDFDSWVEEGREHPEPYGETLADRPRFDVAPDHSAAHPVLRRVASPVEVSSSYLEVMRNNRALDAVAQLRSTPHAFHQRVPGRGLEAVTGEPHPESLSGGGRAWCPHQPRSLLHL